MHAVFRGSDCLRSHRAHRATSCAASTRLNRCSSRAGGDFCAANEEGIAIFEAYASNAVLTLPLLCDLRQASFRHVPRLANSRCRSCADFFASDADVLVLRDFLSLFVRWRKRTPRVSKVLKIKLGFDHLIDRDPVVPGIRFLGKFAGDSGRGTSDPYLRILTYSRTGCEWYECCPRTKHFDNTASPVFADLCIPLDAPDERGLEDRRIRFEAWDWNRIREHVLIGFVEVSVGELRELWRTREVGGAAVLQGEDADNEFLGRMRVLKFMETDPVVFETPEDDASMASFGKVRGSGGGD